MEKILNKDEFGTHDMTTRLQDSQVQMTSFQQNFQISISAKILKHKLKKLKFSINQYISTWQMQWTILVPTPWIDHHKTKSDW